MFNKIERWTPEPSRRHFGVLHERYLIYSPRLVTYDYNKYTRKKRGFAGDFARKV
jgi:hypothetical protein